MVKLRQMCPIRKSTHVRSPNGLWCNSLRWCSKLLSDIEEEVAALRPAVRGGFRDAVDACGWRLDHAPLDALDAVLADRGFAAPPLQRLQLLRLLVFQVHLQRRERIVASLLHLPVCIDSNEIPDRLLGGRTPRATLLREADPRSTVERTREARAVLSTSFSPDLLHDRPLNAALLGTAILTERNPAFCQRFSDRRDALLFDYVGDDLVDQVEWLLERPAEAEELAWEGRRTVTSGSIDYRFGAVLDALDFVGDPRLR